uniref:Uncharacterized protein n=1 Tax=Chromera velia CCMP2878 TaxID=1169474 RepID=A0A0G4HD90_9ALVE|eukprot:Cvel_26304.t1-p1 / transcript=Cvel_26304.t1 / gene=Cvel_26304 / organism=Chromera_velia_CCMP2878 / gene_product=hypothetical protein / transcript_product=hypothetical protein / location=Cvel_scaffold3106:9021-10910(+) / protein_length=541 / sequence_SO=supercontig / SO=protein_coding / is_pseudo=false
MLSVLLTLFPLLKTGVALFEGCPAGDPSVWPGNHRQMTTGRFPQPRETLLSRASEIDGDGSGGLKSASPRHVQDSCQAGQIPLAKIGDGGSAVELTCCDIGDRRCSGCARFDANGCQECLPGYVRQCETGDNGDAQCHRICVACTDFPGFRDADGKECGRACPSCPQFFSDDQRRRGLSKAVEGVSALEACCACGGGMREATPWAYSDQGDLLVGEPVHLFPIPRTAMLYAEGADCELAKLGLRLDSYTGEISGVPIVSEPFTLDCTVTAVQNPQEGLTFNATIALRVLPFSYGSSRMLVDASSDFKLPVRTSRYKYQQGKWWVRCSSSVFWLQLNDISSFYQDGTIQGSSVGAQFQRGGLTDDGFDISASERTTGLNVSEAGSVLTDQQATKCVVTGVRMKSDSEGKTEEGEETDEVTLTLVRSAQWEDIFLPLQFPSDEPLLLTVGRQVTTIQPLIPISQRSSDQDPTSRYARLPPALFSVRCKDAHTGKWITEHVLRTGEVRVVTGPGDESRVTIFHMNPLTGKGGGFGGGGCIHGGF